MKQLRTKFLDTATPPNTPTGNETADTTFRSPSLHCLSYHVSEHSQTVFGQEHSMTGDVTYRRMRWSLGLMVRDELEGDGSNLSQLEANEVNHGKPHSRWAILDYDPVPPANTSKVLLSHQSVSWDIRMYS
jgi:hypothetical protein